MTPLGRSFLLGTLSASALVSGCGRTSLDEESYSVDYAGGSFATGGSPSTGGYFGYGGVAAVGGAAALGGGKATIGGYPATGGTRTRAAGGLQGTGGTKAAGGAIGTGGSRATGGIRATGGSVALGGAKATGGSKALLGGSSATGGKGASGGSPVTGGSRALGGSSGTGGSKGVGGFSGGTAGMVGTGANGGAPLTGGTMGSGGTIGTGGTQSVGGSPLTGGNSSQGGSTACPAYLLANEELIDDLDDGDASLPTINNRRGAWSDALIDTSGAFIFPDPSAPFIPTDTGDVCRKYAAYVTGQTSIDPGSGANFGFSLGSPYDASAYSGLSFWARIDAGTDPPLHVAFPNGDTDPRGAKCQANTTDQTKTCWSHFGLRLVLTSTWTKYTIPFSSLSQDAWGYQAQSFDASTLFSVEFEIGDTSTFGIWIDSVAFTL